MRATLEIPDALFLRSMAAAALRGESLEDLVAAALEAYLSGPGGDAPSSAGWRSVFGKASREDVASVDRIIADEFEQLGW